jgi:hypothetical protein
MMHGTSPEIHLLRGYSQRSASRRSPSITYDAPDYGAASGHSRGNHSPYSEPAGLVAHPPHHHIATTARSASLDRDRDRKGGCPVVPQVSCSRFHRFAQRLTWAPSSRYHPPFPFAAAAVAAQNRRHLRAPHHHAAATSSREHSPDESHESYSRSSTHSPLVSTRPHTATVPSPPTAAAAAAAITVGASSGTTHVVVVSPRASMTAFINTTPGEDVQQLASERQRTSPPVRKRKASEMLGTSASPGSVSPEPSESEAKKKYKKKMNVRHYRAQNKDAMTQLRDVLPEHMRPPERQAKAYVTLSGMWHPHPPPNPQPPHCMVSVTQPSSTFESLQPRTSGCVLRT